MLLNLLYLLFKLFGNSEKH